ncbi:hypothetical protein ADUPG1_012295 [Aduncisulcus paluster]|uniref:Reverse transcriptase/retrotransposon-derived protein RNase H-like domain-containing protein n=1 Tax=Aduncisulcus paluster TaxID=2918883 RepID=A0ABQ5JZR1_9EUKA|nr:hypothetical protein ADUPG1_012295 [Aduncisulcus paluster]
MNKANDWEWKEEQEAAFREVIEELRTGHELVPLQEDLELILYTDVSSVGVGAVLMQKDRNGIEHPILFVSKKLTATQTRWSTGEQEAYIYVGEVFVTLRLEEFEFDIEHMPGKDNIIADVLSRAHCPQNLFSLDVLEEELLGIHKDSQRNVRSFSSSSSAIPFVSFLLYGSAVLGIHKDSQEMGKIVRNKKSDQDSRMTGIQIPYLETLNPETWRKFSRDFKHYKALGGKRTWSTLCSATALRVVKILSGVTHFTTRSYRLADYENRQD